jgi:hypothetical protein
MYELPRHVSTLWAFDSPGNSSDLSALRAPNQACPVQIHEHPPSATLRTEQELSAQRAAITIRTPYLARTEDHISHSPVRTDHIT